MQDRIVRGPDGVTHRFPADATDAEISAALDAAPRPPEAHTSRKRTWTDTAVDALPTISGTVGGLVGGVGGTVAGMGVGGVPGAIGGATLGGALGESVRQLANRVRGNAVPTSAGEAAKAIGLQGGIQGGSEALGGLTTQGAVKGATAVYRGYLKPALSAGLLAKANQIVQTALEEALPITRGGVQKAQTIITELRGLVDDILAKAQGTLDLHDVANRVRAFAKKRYFKPGVDTSDYQLALGVADKLDQHPSLPIQPGTTIRQTAVSLSAANEAKRGLYASIKDAGFGTPQGAKKTTEKFAGHQLKVGLENATGGPIGTVATLNARESKLIDAAEAIAHAVEREANQNKLYGVKMLAAIGVGGGAYARGDDVPTALTKGIVTRALLHPGTQSYLAILAYHIAKQLGVGMATATRLAAYTLQQGSNADQPQNQAQ